MRSHMQSFLRSTPVFQNTLTPLYTYVNLFFPAIRDTHSVIHTIWGLWITLSVFTHWVLCMHIFSSFKENIRRSFGYRWTFCFWFVVHSCSIWWSRVLWEAVPCTQHQPILSLTHSPPWPPWPFQLWVLFPSAKDLLLLNLILSIPSPFLPLPSLSLCRLFPSPFENKSTSCFLLFCS